MDAFDFKEVLDSVILDVTKAHFWDITGVGMLDKAAIKFRREGTHVELVGLDRNSASMVERFAIHDKPGAEATLGGHRGQEQCRTLRTLIVGSTTTAMIRTVHVPVLLVR